jgi:hypothetical protein
MFNFTVETQVIYVVVDRERGFFQTHASSKGIMKGWKWKTLMQMGSLKLMLVPGLTLHAFRWRNCLSHCRHPLDSTRPLQVACARCGPRG